MMFTVQSCMREANQNDLSPLSSSSHDSTWKSQLISFWSFRNILKIYQSGCKVLPERSDLRPRPPHTFIARDKVKD